jgi:hypothetical protein
MNAFQRKLATAIQTLEKRGASDLHVCIVLALDQGCTISSRQVAVATKRFTVVRNVCGNLLHVTLLAPRTLKWLPNFWKIWTPLL